MANGNSGATVGYEAELWKMADALRGAVDPGEYKHIVLGLLFLKYVSDVFEEHHTQLVADPLADPEERDEYTAENIFWVPADARWSVLVTQAKQATIGQTIDRAMDAIERENSSLKGVLPKVYGRPSLDTTRIGRLVDLVTNIQVGDKESRSKDVLGRTYEYFIARFASAEGKSGGEFYTPQCIVRLLVEMLAPYKGRVYDPCCGSGGMFVQSEKFIEEHGGRVGDVAIYGQESNHTTWRLAKMNLAIRGIDASIAHGDSFHADGHPNLKADYILANPPFNLSDWGGERLREDARWQYGVPPTGNANFAWVQHFISHLAPGGTAGFVMANGSMASNQSGEGEIRRRIVEADLVDCMVALPAQLFYSVQIPVCLWFLTRGKSSRCQDRAGEILFIDARELGAMVDRTHRELKAQDIARIADTYHSWRGDPDADATYEDIPGFCKSASLEEVAEHGHMLTPGRYVGAPDAEEDAEPFDAKMKRLTNKLAEQMVEGQRLDDEITRQLERVGYGW